MPSISGAFFIAVYSEIQLLKSSFPLVELSEISQGLVGELEKMKEKDDRFLRKPKF